MKPEIKVILRRTAASAVAVVTSAGVVLGGMFHSPSALPEKQPLPPPPIVLDEDELDGDGKDAPKTAPEQESEAPAEPAPVETEAALPEEEKKGLRRWWASLSLRQRLLFVPLAALACWGVFGLGAAFLPGLLGRLAAWLMTLAALSGGFIAAEKALFPEVPVKELLSSRNFKGLALGAAALGAADCALCLLWSGYARFAPLLHGVGVVGLFLFAALRFAKKTEKAPAPAPEVEAPPEEEDAPKPLTREDILALADTVSRRRR